MHRTSFWHFVTHEYDWADWRKRQWAALHTREVIMGIVLWIALIIWLVWS